MDVVTDVSSYTKNIVLLKKDLSVRNNGDERHAYLVLFKSIKFIRVLYKNNIKYIIDS